MTLIVVFLLNKNVKKKKKARKHTYTFLQKPIMVLVVEN